MNQPVLKLTPINSPLAPQAAGGYSQAMEVLGAQRLLFISGQVPKTAAGVVPPDFEAQAQLVWSNVGAQLQAAGMTLAHLVKVTTFLSSRAYNVANREVRQQVLGQLSPALTVIIAGIFDDQWLLEIEAIAVA